MHLRLCQDQFAYRPLHVKAFHHSKTFSEAATRESVSSQKWRHPVESPPGDTFGQSPKTVPK